MSLQEKLVAELKSSMLAKNADRTAALRMLKSALGYAQIEKKTEALADADVVALLQKEAKKRRDAMEEYGKAGREDLVAKEKGSWLWSRSSFPRPWRNPRSRPWCGRRSRRLAPRARRRWEPS